MSGESMRNHTMSGSTHQPTATMPPEWYTPPEIFEALGLTFDLDPCSPGPGKSYVPTLKHYTLAQDGLGHDWNNNLVFVNPPSGPSTPDWLDKLAHHGNGIALISARTDDTWLHTYGSQCDALCFITTPVRFYRGGISRRDTTTGTVSILLGYGPKAVAALRASGLGACFALVPGTQVATPTP